MTPSAPESQIADKSLSRRRYIKYAAAGVAAVAVAGLGYCGTRPLSTQTETFSSLKLLPPTADFDYNPSYINPTSADTVYFLNKSRNPDGTDTDLDCSWYVDDGMVANSKDYSAQLSSDAIATPHKVRLSACRGGKCGDVEKVLAVDPADLSAYPEKMLRVPIKGITYELCSKFSGDLWAPPTESQMEEYLHVMRNQLHCNGLQILGDCDEVIVTCVKKAIEKGFDTIVVGPRYYKKGPLEDNTIDESVGMTASLAKKLEDFIEHVDLALCVGWEWEISLRGIATSATYAERSYEIYGRYENDWTKWDKMMRPYVEEKLNSYLKQAISQIRSNFGGKLTYSSGEGTRLLVHWNELGLDIVGPMVYYARKYQTQSTFLDELRSYKGYGKPVYVTEFGCFTYEGASLYGGDGWAQYRGQKYSQAEQAQSIIEQVELFDKGGVDGIFLHSFNFPSGITDDAKSQSITRSQYPYTTRERKKSFYAYASFQRD